jgi:hyperosmotically inducible periplasmic protein
MNSVKSIAVVGIIVLLGLSARQASAARPDTWITTQAQISLLTTDGAGRTAVKVDTQKGHVTLHGKVGTEAQKNVAEATVKTIEGVKSVRNLVQVVPETEAAAVKASDSDVKNAVEAALKSHKSLDGIKVESVDNGLVLLEGSTKTHALKLRAIEAAYGCAGVTRVASKIETSET